jgi:hypothetical protein
MTTELRIRIGIPHMLGREDDFENLITGKGSLYTDLVHEIKQAIRNFVSEEVDVGWGNVEVRVEKIR